MKTSLLVLVGTQRKMGERARFAQVVLAEMAPV
jgi:hypothetical protein